MALNGIQIFKLTPKKNCKECGCPTCMAFSMKVAQGAMKIEQCPHMSEDALASLSEATAPPMKTIKIGTGDGEFSLGGETVLFRHEKTFVSKTRYAVSLCTCMSDEEVEAKLAQIPQVDYNGQMTGMPLRMEFVWVWIALHVLILIFALWGMVSKEKSASKKSISRKIEPEKIKSKKTESKKIGRAHV